MTLGCLIFARPKERSWDVRMMIPRPRKKQSKSVIESLSGAWVKLTDLDDPQPNRIFRVKLRWVLSAE